VHGTFWCVTPSHGTFHLAHRMSKAPGRPTRTPLLHRRGFHRPFCLTSLRAGPTVICTEASQFRRVLQDIGESDHPKRIRHCEWLESSLTIPFQFSQEPGHRPAPAGDTSRDVTECTTRWRSSRFRMSFGSTGSGVLQACSNVCMQPETFTFPRVATPTRCFSEEKTNARS
jgi:hypothetical protein